MQIVRSIVWVVLLVTLLAFSFFNWTPVEVRLWTNLVMETKLPALVVVAFLLGLVPMWLVHRGSKWQMRRRMTALETATTRMNTPAAAAAAPSVAVPDSTAVQPDPLDRSRDYPPASAPVAQPANPVDPEPHRPTKPE